MGSPCATTESSPHLTQLEKACTQQWRPKTAKKKKKNLFLSSDLTPIKWESFVKSKICCSIGLIIFKKMQLLCSWALHISSAQRHIQIFWFVCLYCITLINMLVLLLYFRHEFFTPYCGRRKFSFFSDTHSPCTSASTLTPSNFVVLYFLKDPSPAFTLQWQCKH